MSNSIQLLQILKKELLTFFDELISILPEEQDFIVMRFFIENHVSITEVMEYICNKLVPLEHFVDNRDDRFFLENQVLFEDLKDDKSKVNYFKDMWNNRNDQQDQENKEIVWKWFKHFITLAKRYKNFIETL